MRTVQNWLINYYEVTTNKVIDKIIILIFVLVNFKNNTNIRNKTYLKRQNNNDFKSFIASIFNIPHPL